MIEDRRLLTYALTPDGLKQIMILRRYEALEEAMRWIIENIKLKDTEILKFYFVEEEDV